MARVMSITINNKDRTRWYYHVDGRLIKNKNGEKCLVMKNLEARKQRTISENDKHAVKKIAEICHLSVTK